MDHQTNMRRIQIYDTTLRDGSQGEGVSFSLQDKLLIARRLLELGFDYVEGGYPLSNDKDTQFFERAAQFADGRGRIWLLYRRHADPETSNGERWVSFARS